MPLESELKAIGVPEHLVSQVVILMGLLAKISSENYQWAARCKELGLSQEEAVQELIQYHFAHHERIVDDAFNNRNQRVFDFIENSKADIIFEEFVQGFDDSVKTVICSLTTKSSSIHFQELMNDLKTHNVDVYHMAEVFNVSYKEKLELGDDEDILIQINHKRIVSLRHELRKSKDSPYCQS